ncbi:MAG: hypothetical protein SNJ76_07245 [Fimbriimonadaceae bacterium]
MRLVAAALATALAGLASANVPRNEAFPVGELPPNLRERAEAVLLRALDTEALYTIVGGMKPMSSGFVSHREPVDAPDLARIEETRRVLRALRCGNELMWDLHHFARPWDAMRSMEGVVFNGPAMRRLMVDRSGFFGFFGLTPSANPMEVLMAVEYADQPRRHRGYGYLFGYPRYAVDFFVEAQAEQRRTGTFVERDFFQVETFGAATGRFVWAVPKGHVANEADLAIQRQANRILAYYRSIRPRYIGEGRPGAVALLKDWMDDGRGRLSSAEALRKVEAWWRTRESGAPASPSGQGAKSARAAWLPAGTPAF